MEALPDFGTSLKPPKCSHRSHRVNFYLADYPLEMNLHEGAKFGPDRTTGGDVHTLGRIHTHAHTLLLLDID